MPFQSEKQRRYLHANHPEIAKRWEQEYAGGGIARKEFLTGGFPDFFQMTPENMATARSTPWSTALNQDFNPWSKDYRGFTTGYRGADKSGLGKYVSGGLKSLAGVYEPGSNIGGATNLMRKLALGTSKHLPKLLSKAALPFELLRASPVNADEAEMSIEDFQNLNNSGIMENIDWSQYSEPSVRQGFGDEEWQSDPWGNRRMELEKIDEPAGYTRFRDTDNLMEYINKNPELMETIQDTAGGIWDSGIDKGKWALGALGAAAKMPFQLMGQAANIFNPLSPGSRNYNPDLQGQIDMLKASGILGGEDPSGPYRITGGPLAGKNLVSAFGTNDYGRMLQKRIEYFRQQKAKKGKLTDEQNRRLREAEDAKRKADAAKAARTTHPGGGRKTQGNVGGWSATSTSSGSGQGGGYGTGTGYTDKSSASSGGWKW